MEDIWFLGFRRVSFFPPSLPASLSPSFSPFPPSSLPPSLASFLSSFLCVDKGSITDTEYKIVNTIYSPAFKEHALIGEKDSAMQTAVEVR